MGYFVVCLAVHVFNYGGNHATIFFLTMYEKDRFLAEKVVYFMIRQKILILKIRLYKSENLYKQLKEREKLKKGVAYLERKARQILFMLSFRKKMSIIKRDYV